MKLYMELRYKLKTDPKRGYHFGVSVMQSLSDDIIATLTRQGFLRVWNIQEKKTKKTEFAKEEEESRSNDRGEVVYVEDEAAEDDEEAEESEVDKEFPSDSSVQVCRNPISSIEIEAYQPDTSQLPLRLVAVPPVLDLRLEQPIHVDKTTVIRRSVVITSDKSWCTNRKEIPAALQWDIPPYVTHELEKECCSWDGGWLPRHGDEGRIVYRWDANEWEAVQSQIDAGFTFGLDPSGQPVDLVLVLVQSIYYVLVRASALRLLTEDAS